MGWEALLSNVARASVLFAVLGLSASAAAEEDPIDAWARWVVQPRGKVPTGPFPDAVSRPLLDGWVVDSEFRPLRVHAGAAIASARVEAALRHLEAAYDVLVETGWPLPLPDGGYGGAPGFDLYLLDDASAAVRADLDVPVTHTGMDGATSYAVADASAFAARPEACAIAALVEAALLGQDPAETPGARRATGALVAYLATGDFGCDDAVVQRQRAPHGGWREVADEAEFDTGAALLLAALGERQDRGTGAFVREVWQFARQGSDGLKLQVSPTFWEALERALTNADESFEEIVEDIAVARFLGTQASGDAARYAALRALPARARVPLLRSVELAELPEQVVLDPPLARYGSAYVRVELSAREPSSLRVWLRGEAGPRWSLVVVRLDETGRELGRVSAPPRRLAQSYVPLVATADTHAVLIVVTKLAPDRKVLRNASDVPHHGRLIIDTE